jgi:hypothetical protein
MAINNALLSAVSGGSFIYVAPVETMATVTGTHFQFAPGIGVSAAHLTLDPTLMTGTSVDH